MIPLKWSKLTYYDYLKEKQALKQYILNHGKSEIDSLTPVKFLDGELYINYLEENDNEEAWFNINVHYIDDVTINDVIDSVIDYAFHFYRLLNKSKVDINTFVLSFNINIEGDDKSRNIFFRASRSELSNVISPLDAAPKNILQLETKLFDKLFRP